MAVQPADPSVRDQMVDNQKIIDRLNNELARKTDEVRIIQQISSEISSTLDLDRILAISLDAMETVLGFRHSMILLASADERVLTVAASRGYDGGELAPRSRGAGRARRGGAAAAHCAHGQCRDAAGLSRRRARPHGGRGASHA